MSTLVGIGGPKAHGKDTLAGFLANTPESVVFGMSDRLLRAYLQLNPLVVVQPELGIRDHDGGLVQGLVRARNLVDQVGFTEAKRVPEVRETLVILGTHIVRDVAPNAWVDDMRKRVAAALRDGKRVLVTGIRFPNELQLIRDLGGSAVWVERPGHPVSTNLADPSEHSLTATDFDLVVLNSGTVADLEVKAARILPDLFGWARQVRAPPHSSEA